MKNDLENYHLLKTIESDNSVVEIYDVNDKKINKERQNLINLYDVIFEISNNLTARGIDTNDWFFSESQIKDMKKNSNYKFI